MKPPASAEQEASMRILSLAVAVTFSVVTIASFVTVASFIAVALAAAAPATLAFVTLTFTRWPACS